MEKEIFKGLKKDIEEKEDANVRQIQATLSDEVNEANKAMYKKVEVNVLQDFNVGIMADVLVMSNIKENGVN